ncbi:hypothetical protein APR04_005058 [Promicromonospora umidemergens]|uniref:Uncharacterized protein n=1 Tax=Promicromonospora umidemergens TaxID=629679 RepID=A0ABP8WZ78_9MICO|nr:hypothetical protein [Promicromonospora umidemergens]MCP2286122.1 hypothetical protein [Promicromonospora umidemergens]
MRQVQAASDLRIAKTFRHRGRDLPLTVGERYEGSLDWLESTTLKGEQEAKTRQQKERADRVAKSSAR